MARMAELTGQEDFASAPEDAEDAKTEAASSTMRSLNIICAFVGEHTAYALVDFCRLARIYVNSRDELWTQEDMTPGSEVSSITLF